jgi:large subunit ribosomal protein L3
MISIPERTGLGKKKPEIFEAPIGGPDAKAKIEYARGILGKELAISDIISEGEYLDAIAVTTGKGWQGVVKRYGVALNTHKSTKARRHGGSIGAETQGKVMFTIPRAGQMGFHRRVDKAKRVLMVSQDAKQVLPPDGFIHYGKIQSPYILLEGSVPGPAKRAILLRKSVLSRTARKPVIKEISKESKQG